MSGGYTFTPAAEGADPEAVAAFQARLAKLAPACMDCGRKLTAREVAGHLCADRDLCRVRRSGVSVAGYVTLRKFALRNAAPATRTPAPAVAAAVPASVPTPVPAIAARPEPIAPAPPLTGPLTPPASESSLIASWARMFCPPEPRARRWPIV